MKELYVICAFGLGGCAAMIYGAFLGACSILQAPDTGNPAVVRPVKKVTQTAECASEFLESLEMEAYT